MKLHLACSGGFANLRIEGSVDTAELPEELARRVERELHPEKLAAAGAAAASPLVADGQQYELTLLSEGEEGGARQHRLDDSALSEGLCEVLDELRLEIVRRKRAAAQGE